MNPKKAFSLIELSIVILIIGILIAGITQSSRLIRQMKVASAKSLTQGSGVASIKNLAFWVEPVMENGVTGAINGFSIDNEEAVTFWNDINPQATSKINVTQGTGENRPLYKIDGINGLPSIDFDGIDDFLASTTIPLPVAATNYTIIVVWRSDTYVDVLGRSLVCQGAASANNIACLYLPTVSTVGFAGHSNDYTPTTYAQNVNNISTIRLDNRVTNNVSVYHNGNTATTGPSTGGATALNLTGGSFAIAARSTALDLVFGGFISEVIVFDRALKQSEIQEIHAYLSKKYAIKLVN